MEKNTGQKTKPEKGGPSHNKRTGYGRKKSDSRNKKGVECSYTLITESEQYWEMQLQGGGARERRGNSTTSLIEIVLELGEREGG